MNLRCTGLVLTLAVLLPAAARAGEPDFKNLFAAGDLSGWVEEQHNFYKAKHPNVHTWSIKDGVVHCSGEGGNCGYLRCEKRLGDFTLQLEYNVSTKCNSGVCIRCRVPYNGIPNQTLPSHVGFEVQVLDDAGQPATKTSSGAFYGLLPPRVNAAKPAGQWNKLEIVCRGPKIRVTLNGQLIQDVDQSAVEALKGRQQSGYLALQNHGRPIDYRHIKLKAE